MKKFGLGLSNNDIIEDHLIKSERRYSFDDYYYSTDKSVDYPNDSNSDYSYTYVSKCTKINDSMVYKPKFVIDEDNVYGMIVVYKDSLCSKYLSSEPNVHKITSIYKCKNCRLYASLHISSSVNSAFHPNSFKA